MSGAAAGNPAGGDRRSLGLDDLVALNDEIVALVRAGLPLEPGLTGAGRDLPGRLGRVTSALADRMARGEGLAEALGAERAAVPPVYRAVVEAGLRAGRPAAALEGLADYIRRYLDTRRVLGLALIYPMLVVLLAYALLVGFVVVVAPRFVAAFEVLRVPGRTTVGGLARLGEWLPYWGPIVPVAVVVAITAWYHSGRSSAFSGGRGAGVLGWVPWFGGLLGLARTANFADLLALLIEAGVTLPDAVELAADAAGDAALRQDARTLAEALRRGESTAGALMGLGGRGRPSAFPPILRWLMAVGDRRGAIAPALRHAADTYRRRAELRADLIRAILPTALVLAIGAAAVLVYALVLFLPFTTLLRGLTEAPGM